MRLKTIRAVLFYDRLFDLDTYESYHVVNWKNVCYSGYYLIDKNYDVVIRDFCTSFYHEATVNDDCRDITIEYAPYFIRFEMYRFLMKYYGNYLTVKQWINKLDLL